MLMKPPGGARRLVDCAVRRKPLAVQVGFEPGEEIHWAVDSEYNSAEIAGAVSRWDVQGATKGNGEMGIVLAYARAIAKMPATPSAAGMLIAKDDVLVNVVRRSFAHPPPRAVSHRTATRRFRIEARFSP